MIVEPALAALLAGLGVSARFHWWRPRRRGVPVLMYHQVGEHRRGSRLNRWRVTPADFERQLAYLSRKGYRGVSLSEWLDAPESKGKRAVLTFDDGFEGVLTNALPVMKRYGFTGTVFVVAGKIGGGNDWDGENPAERLLDEDGIQQLLRYGVEVGSHGYLHRPLPELTPAERSTETGKSRAVLEEITGRPVRTFCYPYGAFDPASMEAVRLAGYRAATVIRSGIEEGVVNPYRIRRVPVRGTDPFLDFRLALTRGRSKF